MSTEQLLILIGVMLTQSGVMVGYFLRLEHRLGYIKAQQEQQQHQIQQINYDLRAVRR